MSLHLSCWACLRHADLGSQAVVGGWTATTKGRLSRLSEACAPSSYFSATSPAELMDAPPLVWVCDVCELCQIAQQLGDDTAVYSRLVIPNYSRHGGARAGRLFPSARGKAGAPRTARPRDTRRGYNAWSVGRRPWAGLVEAGAARGVAPPVSPGTRTPHAGIAYIRIGAPCLDARRFGGCAYGSP